jgi:importin-7
MNHAASIQFGQLVEIHWKFKSAEQAQRLATSGFDFILLNEADKQCVRDNIMDAVLAQVQNKPIQKQFIRSLKMICIHDYPEKLPNLFPQCLAFLQKNEQLAVYAGLQGLFALAARYEFELDEDREPLHKIIQESFSVLGTLVNDMINNKENVDALYMLHLICKVFYVSNQLQMSPYLMEGNNLQPWIQFLKTIMDMPCPPELSAPATLTEEIVKRDKSIFWKIKGIAAKITYRIFVKYGNPATVEEKVAIQTFSSNFALNFSIPLLESHLQLMFERKDKFVGSKALSFCIKFTSAATKQENTMDKLKPFVENILYDTVIPIMFITEKDMSTFANDPVEYIRNLYDFTETLFQPKNTVQDLLVYLCRYSSQKKQKKKGKSKRGKPDYLHPFLAFAVKNLTEYNSKITSGEGADFRIKEAILYAIGTLKDEIWGEKDLKS